MRTTALSIIALATGLLVPLTASSASAAEPSALKLKGNSSLSCTDAPCAEPSQGNAVQAKYKGSKLSDVTEVCLTFIFVNDLLDPNEELHIRLSDDTPGVGFVNVGVLQAGSRQLCVNSTYHPERTALFADGKQDITVFSGRGSVTISSVTALVS